MIIFLQFFGGLDSLNVFFVQMVKSVVFSHWINSRCVSFCLDNIRKDVPENPSIGQFYASSFFLLLHSIIHWRTFDQLH